MKRILITFCMVLFTLAFSIISYADAEPNGSPGKAEELKLGKTYTGVIHDDESPSDLNSGLDWNSNDRGSDWYYFDAPCDGVATVYVELNADRKETSTGGNRLYFQLGKLDKNNLTTRTGDGWGKEFLFYGSTMSTDKANSVSIYDYDNKYADSTTINATLEKGRHYFRLYGNLVTKFLGGDVYYHTYEFNIEFEPSHSEVKEEIIVPTCSEYGEIKEICEICGETVFTEKVDKLDHVLADEWTTVSEASCTQEGKEVRYCTICNEEAKVKTHKMLPHEFGEWVTDKETSCAEAGEKSQTCSVCGAKETKEIKQLSHKFSKWTTDVEATCQNPGSKSRICSVCNHKETEEIEQLAHKFSKWTVNNKSTCTKSGDRSRTCSICEYIEKEEIELLEHDYGKWEIIKEATCTAEGERKHTCSDCNYTETEKVEMLEHKFGKWTVIKEATESSKGSRTRVCSSCKQQFTEDIPKIICGEDFVWKTVTKATCTSSGQRKKVCEYCNKTIETQTIEAKGHDYSKWTLTRKPTKTSNGTETRQCMECAVSETRSVRLTHGDYGEWKITKEATCKETGVKSFICDCCGKATDTENIPKNSHSYSEWNNSRHASPERKGLKSRACSVCGDTQTEEPEYDFEALKKQADGNAPFTDVMDADWFKPVVGKCYHYKLMVGDSASTFNPNGNITIAEVITSAVRIYCLINPDESKPEITADPWYKGYVDYAIEKGIIKADDFADYDSPATRAEMAYIFVNAATAENLEVINNYEHLPDVPLEYKYSSEIFALYNAGILTGNDAQGTFYPENNIIRAEAAAIIARISGISDRVKK